MAISNAKIEKLTKKQNYIRGYADGRMDGKAEEREKVYKAIKQAERHIEVCYSIDSNRADGMREILEIFVRGAGELEL